MYCTNCGNNLSGAAFCSNCGQRSGDEILFCSQCGQQIADGMIFCPNCGRNAVHSATVRAVGAATYVDTAGLAPGRAFLKVTGILYVIFGSILLFSGALIGMGLMMFLQYQIGYNFHFHFAGMPTLLLLFVQPVAGTIALIPGIIGGYLLILGIAGIANKNNLEKASTLVYLGFINLILHIVVGLIIGLPFAFLVLLTLPVHICYVVGAVKNKEAYEESDD